METVIVTLRLPKDIVDLIRRYLKRAIVSIENEAPAPVGTAPSREEVEAEIKRIGANFTVDRVFIYYNDPKHPWPVDWKAALMKWKAYNLEKASTTKTVTQEERQTAYNDAVKKFMAENKEAS